MLIPTPLPSTTVTPKKGKRNHPALKSQWSSSPGAFRLAPISSAGRHTPLRWAGGRPGGPVPSGLRSGSPFRSASEGRQPDLASIPHVKAKIYMLHRSPHQPGCIGPTGGCGRRAVGWETAVEQYCGGKKAALPGWGTKCSHQSHG